MNTQTLVGVVALSTLLLPACSASQSKLKPSNGSPIGQGNINYNKVSSSQVSSSQVLARRQGAAQRAPAPSRARAVVAQQPRRSNGKGNLLQSSDRELYAIGDKIFQNEAGGKIENLVHWNKREDFASMGVGHFTWYPAGRRQAFGNTFPGLIRYMSQHGANVPPALMRAIQHGAPWRTRAELLRAKNTPFVRETAHFLYHHRHLQAKYIMERAMRAMPKLVRKTPPVLRQRVANNLNAVANTPGGRYVLVDYINFKGEGLARNGGYRGKNWGLLQVLENMQPAPVGRPALNSFANSAQHILERRVRNSPPSRSEHKWLPGWTNRINTYRNFTI